MTRVLLFAANANIGCHIFTYANEKFTNVFAGAFTITTYLLEFIKDVRFTDV